ncbi:retinoic acid receptor beta [Striga asiatica]|uniref:Retinoic acid receptor beta n=1 Tax=Striga asiatica TaxID=4170 RepID=A0A5A7RLX2_STRAF|nr:retinoic acid receptor beta [Striga asiatica]
MFWVKDLLIAGGCEWDVNLVIALFNEEDAHKILLIKSLNPRATDMWRIKIKFFFSAHLCLDPITQAQQVMRPDHYPIEFPLLSDFHSYPSIAHPPPSETTTP